MCDILNAGTSFMKHVKLQNFLQATLHWDDIVHLFFSSKACKHLVVHHQSGSSDVHCEYKPAAFS